MQDATPIEVRVAGVADAGVLAGLLHDFNTEFETDTDPRPVLAERFARILPDDAVLALLATEGSEVTGFALITRRPAIWFDGPVATLDELYVVPARRDHRIGTALLATARDLLHRSGCPEMHINVDEVDMNTRRFYERHGFVNVEDGADYRMLCYIGPTERSAEKPERAAP